MEISEYDLDLEKATQQITKNHYENVAIQVPEGLKRNISQIVEFLENKTQTRIIVAADPCFGACDLVNQKLKNLMLEPSII